MMATLMTKRLLCKHQNDLSQPVIDLDPEEIECKKVQRVYCLNIIQIPILRLAGFGLLIVCNLSHNIFILEHFSWGDFFEITIVQITYALISWIVLYKFYEKFKLFDIGTLFLTLDIFIWTLVIYYSGGEDSLLFWLMGLRVIDQRGTDVKYVLLFGHISTFSYIIMLLYLLYIDHHDISWTSELPKVLAIYGSNLYISIISRTTKQ